MASLDKKKILIQYAHPRPDRSEANVALIESVRNLDFVTINDLYYHYPDFQIDIDREQELLVEHDVLIFQHPVYWYSSPAILKEWQDLVLEFGFAYGHAGLALKGKTFMSAVTCGSAREHYSAQGGNEHELREFFLPFEFTARLCHMHYLPPFVLFSAGYAAEEGRLDRHLEDYGQVLLALAEGRIRLDVLTGTGPAMPTLNDNLEDAIVYNAEAGP